MANEEQLAILKQGVLVWNAWRIQNMNVEVDLNGADLSNYYLVHYILSGVNLSSANLEKVLLYDADLSGANLQGAHLAWSHLNSADLRRAKLNGADLSKVHFNEANLCEADLSRANLFDTDLSQAKVSGTKFSAAAIGSASFGNIDLREAIGLDNVIHAAPSTIGIDTLRLSNGKIPDDFLRGCGLLDWEIEQTKLYNPDLSTEEIDKILYSIHDIRANQAIQISPLFISYSHADSKFVDKVGDRLNKKGIRYWRDIHKATAGPLEEQVNRAIHQNPTVLVILSEHSIKSDWVEHEVRKARETGKELGRHVLCPVALDGGWEKSPWPQRVMEQIMEYNILDFSAWEDDSKFDGTFRKLIDGLELFYKG